LPDIFLFHCFNLGIAKMARFLVTGGCGFIGSHLVDRLLAEGAQVVVLDDLSTGRKENLAPGAELIIGDIRNRNAVRHAMTGVDGCFHLAAIASVEKAREAWLDTHAVNLTGTVTILDTARQISSKGPVPVVYASSAAVYGNPGDDWKGRISEEAPTVPLSAYGADKLGCELHGRVAWTVHGVPTVGFRFFNVYGPRQDPASPYSGVISIFANRVATGAPIRINGDGEQLRDFVFVGDVVSRLTAAMSAMEPGARIFNVCTGQATSVKDLATRLETVFGRSVERIHGPARIGDIRISIGDPARGDAAFGRCVTSLADGLARTKAWLIDEK
jgi:UDP-glucose 4-epimerase